MIISLVAALAKNEVIGKDNQLPWKLPADLRRFKLLTMGKPVLMGRKTFESIGKPLSGRTNLVLTRDASFGVNGGIVVHSPEEALQYAAANGAEELMVIGGETLYKLFLPRAHRMYLTFVLHEFDGDTYFPEYDISEWKEIHCEMHEHDESNPFAHCFMIFERR